MKIKLLQDLPVGSQYGCTKGRIFEVHRNAENHERPHWFILGDTGEEVGVMGHEGDPVSD